MECALIVQVGDGQASIVALASFVEQHSEGDSLNCLNDKSHKALYHDGVSTETVDVED